MVWLNVMSALAHLLTDCSSGICSLNQFTFINVKNVSYLLVNFIDSQLNLVSDIAGCILGSLDRVVS